jgi:hypothetical protein
MNAILQTDALGKSYGQRLALACLRQPQAASRCSAIFLALTAALSGTSFWWIRRRRT